jgi:hypothetical protein
VGACTEYDIQWGVIAISFFSYTILPESPYWAVRHNKMESARKIVSKLHRGVPDFDVDRHIEMIRVTLEHERKEAELNKQLKWYAPLLGTNLVRQKQSKNKVIMADCLISHRYGL